LPAWPPLTIEPFDSGNDLAGCRLAGINLLGGLALGWSRILLADERFLFHSHFGVSDIDLIALRND
jgi:hypothetical protein